MGDDQQDETTYLALQNGVEDQVAQLLVPILADSIYIQNLYKKYHWHVEGEDFYQYHLLFDKHAGEQIPIIDLIAERIRTLGGKAPGMPAEVVSNKTLEEPSEPGRDAQAMVRNLCAVHEAFMRSVRPAIDKTAKLNDVGTNDMLVSDVLRLHELQLWFIRSSISARP